MIICKLAYERQTVIGDWQLGTLLAPADLIKCKDALPNII